MESNMNKYLTIIIPSYNVEKYLSHTINSVLVSKHLEYLEIIIVNDGSKDHTLKIANNYASEYQDIIRVIDKSNGGYGSALNSGIEIASGKYLRILDGDDTITTENLENLLVYLQDQDADLILSEYVVLNHVSDSRKQTNYYYDMNIDRVYSFKEVSNKNIDIHSAIFRTGIYKENHIKIDEHCMYTDVEYVIFGLAYVNSVRFFSGPIYEYHIGIEGQSVSAEGWRKYEKQHEKVFHSLLCYYLSYELTETDESRKKYIRKWINRAWQSRMINGFLINNDELREYFVRWSGNDKILIEKYHGIFGAAVYKETALIRNANYSWILYKLIKLIRSLYKKLKV